MQADTESNSRSKLAYIFPGQGCQHVGMGLELYQHSRAAREVFEGVDEALGTPLSELIFQGPQRELNKTVNSQPAIMAVSLACLKAMAEALGTQASRRPTILAGHSLGEYTALVVSGVLDLPQAVRLVRERGRLMQEASQHHPGGMAAILGLDEVTLEEVCQETGVKIANVNSEDQIVISGDRISLARAMDLASARGARKTLRLAVSGAFHSSLMEPAREGLAKAISGLRLRNPAIPIVANATGRPLTTPRQVKEELLTQLCHCVQWKRSVDYIIDAGVSSFIEFGPGSVLSSLVKRISREVQVVNVADLSSIHRLRG